MTKESSGKPVGFGTKDWCWTTFPSARQLETLFNGCKSECDQKCVIDNHEVEILQTPVFDHCSMWDSSYAGCPSGRVTDLCTPRPVMPTGGGDGPGPSSGFDSQRSMGSHCTPRSARVPGSGTLVTHG